MANVTLEGMDRRRQSFTLPHDLFCEKSGDCRCETITVRTIEHNPRTGEKLPKIVERTIPGEVVIPFRSMVSIHDAVLGCPGVDAALKSKPKKLRLR